MRRDGAEADDSNGLDGLNDVRTAPGVGCVGLYRRYHMCNTHVSPVRIKRIRMNQCKERAWKFEGWGGEGNESTKQEEKKKESRGASQSSVETLCCLEVSYEVK